MARKSFNNWMRYVYKPKSPDQEQFREDWVCDADKPVVHAKDRLTKHVEEYAGGYYGHDAKKRAAAAWKAYEGYMASHG